LAIGADAPILVAKRLLEQVGIAVSELDEARASPRVEPVAL
jgi:bifunctional DNase/RNase